MDLETLREKIEQGDIDGVKDFIKNHPDSINQQDGSSGWTALMFAAGKENTDILKLLLNNDADVNTRDRSFGWTALHLAVSGNQREAVEELLKKTTIQVNLQANSGQTPLHLACSRGYKDIVGSLLSHIGIKPNVVDRQGDTPLHLAVQRQNYDVVTLMLSQDSVELEVKNNKKMTPLLEAISLGHLGIINCLIARGANVNTVDGKGNSCLHLAVKKDRFNSEGAPMDIINECCTDLSLKTEEQFSGVVVARYLASQGADFHHKNNNNNTPLDLIKDPNLRKKFEAFLPPKCLWCRAKAATTKFLPCGHFVTCEKCSKISVKSCLKCGKPVTSTTKDDTQRLQKRDLQNMSQNLGINWQQAVCPNCEYKASHTEPVKTPTPGKKFSKVSEPTPSTSQPVESLNLGEEHLHRVAKKLGSKWQQVGRELGIKQVDLSIIKSDYPHDTVEQSFQMLHKWFQSCDPAKRTLERLREALNETECFDALERLSLDVN